MKNPTKISTQPKTPNYLGLMGIGLFIIIIGVIIYVLNSKGILGTNSSNLISAPSPFEVARMRNAKVLNAIHPVLNTIIGLDSRTPSQIACVQINNGNLSLDKITGLPYGRIDCFTPTKFIQGVGSGNIISYSGATLLAEGIVPVEEKNLPNYLQYYNRLREAIILKGNLTDLRKEAEDRTKDKVPSFTEKLIYLEFTKDIKGASTLRKKMCVDVSQICEPVVTTLTGKTNGQSISKIRFNGTETQVSIKDGIYTASFETFSLTPVQIEYLSGETIIGTDSIAVISTEPSMFMRDILKK